VHGERVPGSLASFVAGAFREAGWAAQTFDATQHDSHVPLALRSVYAVPGLRDAAAWVAAKRFLAYIRRVRPALLVITKGTYLFPESIRAARGLCGKVINLFPDGVSEIQKPGILESLGAYDRVFLKEPYLVDRLRGAGFDNVSYLPQCCEPTVHRPLDLTMAELEAYGADVSLVGSGYPYRVRLLESLALAEVRLRLWGAGWPVGQGLLGRAYAGGEAVGDVQAKVFNATRINLNTAHLQDVYGVNKRTFEIAGCGAFQLAPAQRDLPNLFSVGTEIITYRDVADLRAKIRYYLRHDDERAQVGSAARARVHRDHTYARRIGQILAELKL